MIKVLPSENSVKTTPVSVSSQNNFKLIRELALINLFQCIIDFTDKDKYVKALIFKLIISQ